jgi:pyrroline-5-carboxylate reductase
MNQSIALLGVGNIGSALANGLLNAGYLKPEQLYLTRRNLDKISSFAEKGCHTLSTNTDAVQKANLVVIAVEPHHLGDVLKQIDPVLTEDHTIVSIATGWNIAKIKNQLTLDIPIIRSMPNTAIAIGQSMTCLAGPKGEKMDQTKALFECVGEVTIIDEELMSSATALAACGIAFFLRAIRAAAQGGIEIGFHADQAIKMASQTAKGAASLLLEDEHHPEFEIDRVTTPKGCTIAGLNQLEHGGFSSAMIRGIVTSAEKAVGLGED